MEKFLIVKKIISKMEKLEMYQEMYYIRKVEEKLLELFGQGKLFGTVHTYLGEEFISTGILNNINIEKDFVFSNHRCHGHYLSLFKESKKLFAEIMGKETGMCSGLGGSQHIHEKNFFSNGILGGLFPISAGVAFIEKEKKSNSVVVLFVGDGAMGEGIFYESLNLISLFKLPVLIVVEKNNYAQSTPIHSNLAGDISKRFDAFGIKNKKITSYSVEEVYEESKKIISDMRISSEPHALIIEAYRLGPHSKGDDTRNPLEIEENWKNDPLAILRNSLDITQVEETESAINEKLRTEVAFAEESKFMDNKIFMGGIL